MAYILFFYLIHLTLNLICRFLLHLALCLYTLYTSLLPLLLHLNSLLLHSQHTLGMFYYYQVLALNFLLDWLALLLYHHFLSSPILYILCRLCLSYILHIHLHLFVQALDLELHYHLDYRLLHLLFHLLMFLLLVVLFLVLHLNLM